MTHIKYKTEPFPAPLVSSVSLSATLPSDHHPLPLATRDDDDDDAMQTDSAPSGSNEPPAPPSTPPRNALPPESGPTPNNHAPSTFNERAFDKKTNKALGRLLADRYSMNRFHLLSEPVFDSVVKGDAPTADDRAKFVAPDLSKVENEKDIYPEFVSSHCQISWYRC